MIMFITIAVTITNTTTINILTTIRTIRTILTIIIIIIIYFLWLSSLIHRKWKEVTSTQSFVIELLINLNTLVVAFDENFSQIIT